MLRKAFAHLRWPAAFRKVFARLKRLTAPLKAFAHLKWPLVFVLMAYVILRDVLPIPAGYLFPQAREFRIVSAEPVELDPLRTRFVFEFVKDESDCAFVGLERGVEWYNGTRANGVRVNVIRDPDTPTGPVDVQPGERRASSPWIVDLPVKILMERSEGYFRFRCHPFWENLTRVW